MPRQRLLTGAVLAGATFGLTALVATGVVYAVFDPSLDSGIYWEYARRMSDGLVPYRDFDVEYPPGALLVFALPLFVADGLGGYAGVFALLMALVGAVAVVVTGLTLERLGRAQDQIRRLLVLLAVSPIAFGAVLLTRFDLAPAALVAGSTLLLLGGRHRAASLLLGAAAALKLYPIVLLPLVVAWTWRARERREAALAGALVVGIVVLSYLPFVLAAPGGVWSSLWGQASRPLHIESVGGGALVLLDHLAGLNVEYEHNLRYGSQDVVGSLADTVAVAESAAVLAALSWLWIAFARGEASPERVVRYGAAALAALLAFGKIVSPQLLIWLLFPVVLVGGKRGTAARACFAVAVVTTAVWFPALYSKLAQDQNPAVAALVVLRGSALIATFLLLSWPSTAHLDERTSRAGSPGS